MTSAVWASIPPHHGMSGEKYEKSMTLLRHYYDIIMTLLRLFSDFSLTFL